MIVEERNGRGWIHRKKVRGRRGKGLNAALDER